MLRMLLFECCKDVGIRKLKILHLSLGHPQSSKQSPRKNSQIDPLNHVINKQKPSLPLSVQGYVKNY